MIFLPQGIGHLPIIAYLIVMMNMSVLFGWLYNKTRGSVLLAVLFHAGMNFENAILGSENLQDTYILIIFIILLTALNILIQYRSSSDDFFEKKNILKVALPINSIGCVKCLDTLKEWIILGIVVNNTHSFTMPGNTFLNFTDYGGFEESSKLD